MDRLGQPVPVGSSNAGRTSSVRVRVIARIASTYRLTASRTVSGSQRVPSSVRHQPLKSTVQRSFGSTGVNCRGAGGKPPEDRRCIRVLNPACRKMRLVVDTDGIHMHPVHHWQGATH